ncbi:MAG: rhodanese-related sulfurtransferase [Wenzhouxiangellaceae bacterium]
MGCDVSDITVATFYRFTPLERVAELRARAERLGRDCGLLGTVLLAAEGINATISGERAALDRWQQGLQDLHPGFAGIEFRYSQAPGHPFRRWRVKARKEIVTLGAEVSDPGQLTGEHVDAKQWNALIQRDDVRLVDTRNHYEVELGRFAGAEDPLTDSFREFPQWVAQHLDPQRDRHVAMYCTGGIRCEKASAYLLEQGFENVYQLQGGILEYLRNTPADASLWQGECFIFDDRVALDDALQPSGRQVCCSCRKPMDELKEGDEPICPDCLSSLNDSQLAGVRERIRQVRLAAARGRQHLAPPQRS